MCYLVVGNETTAISMCTFRTFPVIPRVNTTNNVGDPDLNCNWQKKWKEKEVMVFFFLLLGAKIKDIYY